MRRAGGAARVHACTDGIAPWRHPQAHRERGLRTAGGAARAQRVRSFSCRLYNKHELNPARCHCHITNNQRKNNRQQPRLLTPPPPPVHPSTRRYGLKMNNAILAEAAHLPLYAELVDKHAVTYVAGGATQNTVRVAQWMSGQPAGFCAYSGSVGDDAFGRKLKEAAEGDGVTTHYHTDSQHPTGTCAVLVHERERSLVANLSAANHYKKAHYDSEAMQAVVAGARIFYSAGFFLTVSPETMAAMGTHAAQSGKVYAMNLSAPFLCQFFKDQMHAVLPYADFVFGNESEAAAYAAANGFEGAGVEATALRIAALPKASGTRARVVIITQGAQPTVIAQDGVTRTVAVPAIPPERIVDVNGAGDAFVGGFLAFLAKGARIDDAVKAGHWAAGHVLGFSGCVFHRDAKYVPAE
jgi:adenosine kinase